MPLFAGRLLSTLLLAAAALAPVAAGASTSDPLAGSSQLVVVTTADWDANQGQLRTFERGGHGQWQAAGAAWAVAIGRHGSAWGDGTLPVPQDGPHKREGDGRSPAGAFAIGPAFGYAARIDSSLPYRQMQADDWCMDVPDSPLYNRIVSAGDVGAEAVKGSSEAMRLDLHHDGDPRYREGFVIAHNAAAVPGRGSCIFGHLWRQPGEATAGCTAMAAADMQRLLKWLRPERAPQLILLPRAQYARLRAQWHLPSLEAK